jgi:putative endonuclease
MPVLLILMIPFLGKLWPGKAPSAAVAVAGHIELGRRGEAWAIKYLVRVGYQIVAANFELPVGRNARGAIINAEIDVVAYDGPTLCFIEVKTRASDWFASPEVNVDLRKQRQIARAARAYRRMMDLMDAPYRYDVLGVILPPSDSAERRPKATGTLLKDFWRDGKFRKRRWADAADCGMQISDFRFRKRGARL